jgi:hypothetical protein
VGGTNRPGDASTSRAMAHEGMNFEMQAKSTEAPARKYAMAKVAPGDYLLPSNDGRTLWRLVRHEDGPSHGLADWPRDRDVWALWQRREPVPPAALDVSALDDWDRWVLVSDNLSTRAKAIDDAMGREA